MISVFAVHRVFFSLGQTANSFYSVSRNGRAENNLHPKGADVTNK